MKTEADRQEDVEGRPGFPEAGERRTAPKSRNRSGVSGCRESRQMRKADPGGGCSVRERCFYVPADVL